MSTASTTSARYEVRQVVPRLIELTETLLYPDIWERPGLSKRDRSLITAAGLGGRQVLDERPA
jgi:4-carboxymuconolactone decarboxylase